MSYRTLIRAADEAYEPPDQPMLEVGVCGDVAYLTIVKYDEGNADGAVTTTTKELACVGVRVAELRRALDDLETTQREADGAAVALRLESLR